MSLMPLNREETLRVLSENFKSTGVRTMAQQCLVLNAANLNKYNSGRTNKGVKTFIHKTCCGAHKCQHSVFITPAGKVYDPNGEKEMIPEWFHSSYFKKIGYEFPIDVSKFPMNKRKEPLDNNSDTFVDEDDRDLSFGTCHITANALSDIYHHHPYMGKHLTSKSAHRTDPERNFEIWMTLYTMDIHRLLAEAKLSVKGTHKEKLYDI